MLVHSVPVSQRTDNSPRCHSVAGLPHYRIKQLTRTRLINNTVCDEELCLITDSRGIAQANESEIVPINGFGVRMRFDSIRMARRPLGTNQQANDSL
jgi:hypothetical protein